MHRAEGRTSRCRLHVTIPCGVGRFAGPLAVEMRVYRRTGDIVQCAREARLVVPAFNIPYLDMMGPVVQALRDARSFALIEVARLEWVKFQAGSLEAVREQYEQCRDDRHTRLHLDHVPVVDEDGQQVDYLADIRRAIELGYESVMVDGSRLTLARNIAATRQVCELAHERGIPVEGELGAVLGHEEGPMPAYEELFASGRGFTDPGEARQFVRQTGVDWLSVAIGNLHGAISAARRDEKKVPARLSIAHLEKIRQAADVPLVLHGGTGIARQYVQDAIQHGIVKVNIGTAIRQPYERAIQRSGDAARQAVYDAARQVLGEDLQVEGSVEILNP